MDDSIKLISTSTNFHIADIDRLEPKLRDMLRSYREKMKSWNPKHHSLEEAVTVRHFLGNIHLFLHEYHLAISAYSNITNQQFYKLSTLYGISIAYMQIGKFKLASDHLDMVIAAEDENYFQASYLQGMLQKLIFNNHAEAVRNFENALTRRKSMQGYCFATCYEIKFQIATTLANSDSLSHRPKAEEKFKELIAEKSKLPEEILACTLSCYAWYCFEKNNNQLSPLNTHLLPESLKIFERMAQNSSVNYSKDDHGKALYYYGRINAATNRPPEAFAAFRHSIDKLEESTVTWTAIGCLYQEQNQKLDALQAYICSVRLDKLNDAAWSNLGLLYESCEQWEDALICALNSQTSIHPKLDNNLTQRITKITNILQRLADSENYQPKKQIQDLETAWNLPIPSQLNQRLEPKKWGFAKVKQLDQSCSTYSIYQQVQVLKEKFDNHEKDKKFEHLSSSHILDDKNRQILKNLRQNKQRSAEQI